MVATHVSSDRVEDGLEIGATAKANDAMDAEVYDPSTALAIDWADNPPLPFFFSSGEDDEENERVEVVKVKFEQTVTIEVNGGEYVCTTTYQYLGEDEDEPGVEIWKMIQDEVRLAESDDTDNDDNHPTESDKSLEEQNSKASRTRRCHSA